MVSGVWSSRTRKGISSSMYIIACSSKLVGRQGWSKFKGKVLKHVDKTFEHVLLACKKKQYI